MLFQLYNRIKLQEHKGVMISNVACFHLLVLLSRRTQKNIKSWLQKYKTFGPPYSGLVHTLQNPPPPRFLFCLLRCKHNTLILLTTNHLQGMVKVFLARLYGGRVLLVTGQVGVDELDEAVQVFGCYLWMLVSLALGGWEEYVPIHSAGRSSRRICLESRRRARWMWQTPCTSLLLSGHAGDTLGHACRRGTAMIWLVTGGNVT